MKPEQLGAINPLVVIVLLVVTDQIVWPLLRRCHIRCTALRKMAVGLMLNVLACFGIIVLLVRNIL